MIKDVKSYINTVGSRLTRAFKIQDFDQEAEVEFWSLSAELMSREQAPKFRDMVEWIDLIFKAPVHFVYRKQGDHLVLFRRQPLLENLDSGEPRTPELVRDFEEQVENLQPKIRFREAFKFVDIASFSVGSCQYVPLYHGSELWGIYGVGPGVRIPDELISRISVISRILGGWLVQHRKMQEKSERRLTEKLKREIRHASSYNIEFENIAHYLITYLLNATGAHAALFSRQAEQQEILQGVNLPDEIVTAYNTSVGGPGHFDFNSFYEQHRELFESHGISSWQTVTVQGEEAGLYLHLFAREPDFDGQDREGAVGLVTSALARLLHIEEDNRLFVDQLLESYYHMIRSLERKKERAYYHTDRMVAFCRRFGLLFGLNEDEEELLIRTAKMHDIGYLSIKSRSIGSEVEHPILGQMMIEGLGLPEEITTGVASHHEWVDGSGTPRGLTEDEIPWTGKVIGIFEFIIQFIEEHGGETSNDGEKLLAELLETVKSRAGKQFDLLIVPTVSEMLQMLGWKECCRMGTDDV